MTSANGSLRKSMNQRWNKEVFDIKLLWNIFKNCAFEVEIEISVKILQKIRQTQKKFFFKKYFFFFSFLLEFKFFCILFLPKSLFFDNDKKIQILTNRWKSQIYSKINQTFLFLSQTNSYSGQVKTSWRRK